MKKTLLFVCLFGSTSLAFAEDTATKAEVYAQVGRLDERITETRSVLDNRITMSVKSLTIASRVSMFDLIKLIKI